MNNSARWSQRWNRERWSRTSILLEYRPLRLGGTEYVTPSALGLFWRGKLGLMRCTKPCQRWLERPQALHLTENRTRCLKVSTFLHSVYHCIQPFSLKHKHQFCLAPHCFRTSDKDGKLGWLIMRDVSPSQGLLQSVISDWIADWRSPWEGETSLNHPNFPSLSDVLKEVFSSA